MQIIPLSEGTFTIDSTKLFIPFDDKEHEIHSRPIGSLLVEIQPFVVITSKDILLLDTGLGFMQKDILQILKNLSEVGLHPSDITKVLLSHLHKDHAGGITSGDNHRKLNFPSATYFIQKKEFDFAFEKGFPSYITEELAALKNHTQVTLLNNEEGFIDEYIEYKVTGAHSPFHQVFWIREHQQIIFFGGDDAPQLQQMKHRFSAKYDYDGKKAMGLRREWWEKGKNENWTFLFYHDVKHPVYPQL